jgi:hypothetical protein
VRLRRFETAPGKDPFVLARSHPAVVDGTTLFRARISEVSEMDRLFKSGMHSRKIGGKVAKGAWRGMPIYTLTLTERATCPRSCSHWADCYGNKMNWSARIVHGRELERTIPMELATLARKYRRGFVVRLHVLGDFYSAEYVRLWRIWLEHFPTMRVFGYTAWQPDTDIGKEIAFLREDFCERWWVRFSGGPYGFLRTSEKGIVCPAMTGQTACCATCALCWSTLKDISFPDH